MKERIEDILVKPNGSLTINMIGRESMYFEEWCE